MPQIALPGATIEYRESGPADSAHPPVVFVHGALCAHDDWAPQLMHFARRHRVVAPDLRGLGQSDRPGDVEEYRLRRSVNDLVAITGQLGISSAHVVGHDFGAAVFRTQTRHSARIVDESHVPQAVASSARRLAASTVGYELMVILFLSCRLWRR